MSASAEEPRVVPASARRLVVNVLLAGGGLALFGYLVHGSGVSLAMLREIGWGWLGGLFAVSFFVIFVDTLAWRWALHHTARVPILPLLGLRIAGDSVSNGVPGGVVFGETYKAMMVRRWWSVSLADNALALVLIKFGLGISQAVFVLLGLVFAYPTLRARSTEVFGFAGAEYIAFVLAAGMGIALFVPLALLQSGVALERVLDLLRRLPGLGARLEKHRAAVVFADQRVAQVLRDHRRTFAVTFAYLLLGWLATVGETYILLHAMGFSPSLGAAFAIESLGSLFRLIFFMVPSGIGGQDASFLALFSLYGLPAASGGVFVLVKRFKELLWIGLGFGLIAALRRAPQGGLTPRSEEPSPLELHD